MSQVFCSRISVADIVVLVRMAETDNESRSLSGNLQDSEAVVSEYHHPSPSENESVVVGPGGNLLLANYYLRLA